MTTEATSPYMRQFNQTYAGIIRIKSLRPSEMEEAEKIMSGDALLCKLPQMEVSEDLRKDFYNSHRWIKYIRSDKLPYVIFRCVGILLRMNTQIVTHTSDAKTVYQQVRGFYADEAHSVFRFASFRYPESFLAINRRAATVMELSAFKDAEGLTFTDLSPILEGVKLSPVPHIRDIPDQCHHYCSAFLKSVEKNEAEYPICRDALKTTPLADEIQTLILSYFFKDGIKPAESLFLQPDPLSPVPPPLLLPPPAAQTESRSCTIL